MENKVLNKSRCRQLITAACFLAVSLAILGISLGIGFSGGREASLPENVSASHAVAKRTGVHQQFFAGGSTTSAVSSSDSTAFTTAPNKVKHKKSDFVRVREYIPDIEVDLKYATEENFTGKVIYDFSDAWLRYGTVMKLSRAQEKLKEKGMRLKIWDAFRPVNAQFKLWKICPDARYVANPNKGYSSHSRGNTVDVTLVDMDGNEVAMPTAFDDFTKLADRNYSDIKDKTAVSNVKLLEKTMSGCGFRPYYGEWWHFSDSDVFGVAKKFSPASSEKDG